MTLRSTLAGLALAAVAVSHAQTVLYSTGFEQSGSLWADDSQVVGQDGWSSGILQNSALRVSTARARTGSQSAVLNLRDASGSPLSFFYRPVQYPASNTDLLIGRTSFFADNPGGGQFEIFIEGTSGTEISRFGGLLFNDSGSVYWHDGEDYQYKDTLAWNRWHDVEIRFDFATKTSSVLLNSIPLGTGDFEELANTTFHDLTLGVQTEGTDTLSGSIFFDDYSVSLASAQAEPIPEPFTMMLGAAALGLAAARKRRRKS